MQIFTYSFMVHTYRVFFSKYHYIKNEKKSWIHTRRCFSYKYKKKGLAQSTFEIFCTEIAYFQDFSLFRCNMYFSLVYMKKKKLPCFVCKSMFKRIAFLYENVFTPLKRFIKKKFLLVCTKIVSFFCFIIHQNNLKFRGNSILFRSGTLSSQNKNIYTLLFFSIIFFHWRKPKFRIVKIKIFN